jgi:SAM-dependent methyltransferase
MKKEHTAGFDSTVEVKKRYDEEYGQSIALQGAQLLISRERLFRNYGVTEPERYRDSERLTIALDVIDNECPAGPCILDYGCGSGKSSVVLAQNGAEVFGFDISENSVKVGKRRAKVNGVEQNAHFLVASGFALPFPSDWFDCVFGYEVLYYLNGRISFGDEILRVLKPGGKAIFCEALAGNKILGGVRKILRFITRTVNRTGGTPLTVEDIDQEFEKPATIETYPINILGMARRILAGRGFVPETALRALKGVDRFVLGRYPDARKWCGEIVIVVSKYRPP